VFGDERKKELLLVVHLRKNSFCLEAGAALRMGCGSGDI
jgi:hypothetical protein